MNIPLPRRATHLLSALTIVLLPAIGYPFEALAQDSEEHEHKNLQVLPEDISEDALHDIMEGFTDALGVGCTHCHVRREGQRPDFAADDKPEKRTARVMLRMVAEINGWDLKNLPTVEGEALPVSCMTCHRGLTKPQTLDYLLAHYVPEHGIEATLARYDSLKSEYYGTAAYDFSESSFVRLGRRMIANGQPSDALIFLNKNIELFPNSVPTYVTLSEAYVKLGDHDRAVESLEHAVALQPRNGFLLRQLEELRGQ